MTTSLKTASAVDTPKTIRAAINERNLFGTMGQWFASTYSFLGETMQNSRRAGATFVSYDVQHNAHGGVDLVISDDGAGIDDFQMLLQLAESGWSDESVLLTEKPFGMGLFSVFYACERVTFSSKGQTVTVSLNDIVERRELQVRADSKAPAAGTTITLHNPSEEITKDVFPTDASNAIRSRLHNRLVKLAEGFAIPVHYCGVELERPNAQSMLNFTLTDVGAVWIPGIDSQGQAIGDLNAIRLYLQGLPIEENERYSRHHDRSCIVHLDSETFLPVMPDRARLQDSVQQIDRVKQAIQERLAQFLLTEKARLSGEAFVEKYFQTLTTHKTNMWLLNSIPFLPQEAFRTVHYVSIDCGEVFGPLTLPRDKQLISRTQLCNGELTVFKHEPYSTTEMDWAAVLLKVMQREEILSLTHDLHGDHWIQALVHSVFDLKVELDVINPVGRESVAAGDYSWEPLKTPISRPTPPHPTRQSPDEQAQSPQRHQVRPLCRRSAQAQDRNAGRSAAGHCPAH